MQTVRNMLFYFSPLAGALLGGLIGFYLHVFALIVGLLAGFGIGCAVSVLMVVVSIRARFKSDVSLTQNPLEKESARDSESGLK
jgi:uncharacterized membrane protein